MSYIKFAHTRHAVNVTLQYIYNVSIVSYTKFAHTRHAVNVTLQYI